jgi:hypothetical protein
MIDFIFQEVSPWLRYRREWSVCSAVYLTMTGLQGAEARSGAIDIQERSADRGLPVSYFGNVGEWDNMNKSLVLQVKRLLPAMTKHIISFVVRNPSYGQESPQIALSGSGIVIQEQLVTKDVNGTTGLQGARKGDAAPLKIYPLAPIRAYYPGANNAYHNSMGMASVLSSTDLGSSFGTAAAFPASPFPGHTALKADAWQMQQQQLRSDVVPGDTDAEQQRRGRTLLSMEPSHDQETGARKVSAAHVTENEYSDSHTRNHIRAVDQLQAAKEDRQQSMRQQDCAPAGGSVPPTMCSAILGQQYAYPAVTNTIALTIRPNVDLPIGQRAVCENIRHHAVCAFETYYAPWHCHPILLCVCLKSSWRGFWADH